jgi:hypothetical protein
MGLGLRTGPIARTAELTVLKVATTALKWLIAR